MKKLLIGTGVAAALVAGVGSANAVDQQIVLGGTVASFCTIDGSTSPGAITPSFPTVTDGNVPGGLTMDVPIGDVVCNSNANVTLTSANGAAITGTSAAGFQNYVNYKASVSSPASVMLEANSTTGTTNALSAGPAASGGPSSGAVSVHLESVANTLPLVAGAYNDTLTVSINPI